MHIYFFQIGTCYSRRFVSSILLFVHLPFFAAIYPSGPNNGVFLNERVGWIFCSPFIGENACLWKFFKSYLGEKAHVGVILL